MPIKKDVATGMNEYNPNYREGVLFRCSDYALAPTSKFGTINMMAGHLTKPEIHGAMCHLHGHNIIHLLRQPFNITGLARILKYCMVQKKILSIAIWSINIISITQQHAIYLNILFALRIICDINNQGSELITLKCFWFLVVVIG